MKDTESIDQKYKEVSAQLIDIKATQEQILEKLHKLEELEEIYSTGKGFVKGWRAIGKVLIWLTLTGGALMAIIKYLSNLIRPTG